MKNITASFIFNPNAIESKDIVITFTRHQMTEIQKQMMFDEICEYGNVKKAFFDMTEEASIDIVNEEQAKEIFSQIMSCANAHGADIVDIFGVIPTPIRQEFVMEGEDGKDKRNTVHIHFHEAWNTSRAIEGSKPTFEFKKWCWTGVFDVIK